MSGKSGGPREGNGGAVNVAMRATVTGLSECANGSGGVKTAGISGGAPDSDAHKGQSRFELLADESWPSTTILTIPDVEHTKSETLGLTTGEAIATPRDNTNPINTNRMIVKDCLTLCIFKL